VTKVKSGGIQPANISVIHRRNHCLHPDPVMVLCGGVSCHNTDEESRSIHIGVYLEQTIRCPPDAVRGLQPQQGGEDDGRMAGGGVRVISGRSPLLHGIALICSLSGEP